MKARTAIVAAVIGGIVVLGLTQLASTLWDEPVSTFTRDFQVTADVPWYTGQVSVLNNMLWIACATLSLFVAWLVPSYRRVLLVFGGFTLVLGADDALLLHDAAGPRNGIPQELFIVIYAAFAVLMLWLLRKSSRGVLVAFVLGAALLGVSAGVDQVLPPDHLLEDGAKLLGTLVWLTLPLIVCAQVRLVPATGDAAARSPAPIP